MHRSRGTQRRFVVCIRNVGCGASLDLRKIYVAEPDADAEGHGLVRIVDESGESYLYPRACFVPIELPASLRRALARTA